MPTIDEITIADEPERWSALGFDVVDGVCQVAGVRLRLAGEQGGEGVLGWSLRELRSEDLDGLPTTRSQRPALAPALPHPNGVVAIDHVVAVSPDLDRSVAAMQTAGLDLRRIREEPTPAGAPRQAFFRLGREILELVQEPEQIVAQTGGPQRPVRFWGLALLVDDIGETVGRMSPHAQAPRPAVQPSRRISTVARSAGLAIPLALMTREQDAEAQR
ncbi:MAG: VOC family protein [Solirubrobacteraceae bacterium]